MKAILVIDVPQEDIGKSASILYLGNDKYLRSIEFIPIQPMPEPIYVEVNEIEDLMHTEFSIENLSAKIRLDTDKLISLGWNACLEEIEK